MIAPAQLARADDPEIHVRWDGGGPQPERNTHYRLTDGEWPEIQLLAESTKWRIWSTNGNDPGDIGRIWTENDGDFTVKILDESGNPGARHVNDIDLRPANNGVSVVNAGIITGNLGGAYVQGATNFILKVLGDVTGVVQSEGDLCMEVVGSVTEDGAIYAQQLSTGCGLLGMVFVHENVAGPIVIAGDIQGGEWLGQGSFIRIDGSVVGPDGGVSFQRLHYTDKMIFGGHRTPR